MGSFSMKRATHWSTTSSSHILAMAACALITIACPLALSSTSCAATGPARCEASLTFCRHFHSLPNCGVSRSRYLALPKPRRILRASFTPTRHLAALARGTWHHVRGRYGP